jgi:predicted enzyme related to lactoylglutathione lyase
MNRLINWIEIPVRDLARAKAFYEQVFDAPLAALTVGELQYAMFPTRNRFNTGALVQGEGYVPSDSGPLLYLDATGEVDCLLDRIVAAGGTVVMPRTYLSPEAGEVAIFVDTEGNRLGLQSAVDMKETTPIDDGTMHRLLGSTSPVISFLVRRGPAYDNPATVPLQWEHARHMFELMRDGKLAAVTVLMDGTDVLGTGILKVRSKKEAEELLNADPSVRGGRFTMQILGGPSFCASEVQF